MAATRPAYTPTPAEIRQACAQIRANWNESVRQSRQVHGVSRWSLPGISVVITEEWKAARDSVASGANSGDLT